MGKVGELVRKWAEARWENPPELQWSEDGANASMKIATLCGDIEYEAYLDLRENPPFLSIYIYGSTPVPESRLSYVHQAISLINPELDLGNFEVVHRGKSWFRFRVGINLEDGMLSSALSDNILEEPVSTMRRFYPAIIAITHAGAEPCRAVHDAFGRHYELPSEIESDSERCEPDSPSLKEWAIEMNRAITEGQNNSWVLIGHGVIVEHTDLDRAEEMIRRVASVAGMNFTVIEDEDVTDIPLNSFDPFAVHAPILVYLKPGDWMIDPDNTDKESLEALRKFRTGLISRMNEFDSAHPVIYVTAVKDMDHVCDSLRQCDAFDRYFSLPALTTAQLGHEFINLFGKESCDESVSAHPGKVGELLEGNFDNRRMRGILLREVERVNARSGRKLRFTDLVRIVINGPGSSDEAPQENPLSLQYAAVHEAGHAAVAMLDSDGRNVPEYSTVISRRRSGGTVVESMSYHFEKGGLFTHADFVRNVRIALAGRAAEEVAYGREGITSGARGDLENCVRIARKAFARWGFSPEINLSSSDNLAVVVGDPSESEMQYVEELMRRFLDMEYRKVIEILKNHRPLLDEIAANLVERGVLDQGEIEGIYAAHL